MRLVELGARIGCMRITHITLGKEPKAKRPFGRSRLRREDGIKIYIKYCVKVARLHSRGATRDGD